jgi:hypothetical protein
LGNSRSGAEDKARAIALKKVSFVEDTSGLESHF